MDPFGDQTKKCTIFEGGVVLEGFESLELFLSERLRDYEILHP